MMNNEMMRQMQARIQKMQDDLATETVEATAGGGAVTVTVSGIGMGPAQAKIQSISISPEAVDPEDVETLEDLVLAAVNEALGKAQQVAADKMSALTGGMKIPGMF
jgi:DNA-binding YbaB/EbfC family protein